MSKLFKRAKFSQEKILIFVGILLLLLMLLAAVYFIGSLSTDLGTAFGEGTDSNQGINFNLEGFKKLELK